MFISVELENIGPYTNNVIFDFKINKKATKNIESTITLPDGLMVSKIIGVIAGNASGKTTFIDALTSIGAYIDIPYKRIKMTPVEDFIKRTDVTPVSREAYKEYFSFMQDFNPLIPVNKSNVNNIGTIKIEMYIDSNNKYEGYYQYTLKYDSNVKDNGVIMESLDFKKKYSGKYKNLFCTERGSKESEIGSKLGSKQNWIVELDKAGMDVSAFEERMKYYETFFERYINESSIMNFDSLVDENDVAEAIKDNKELFKRALKIVDNSVSDVEVDIDSEYNKVFAVYDGYKLRYNSLSTATMKVCDFVYNLLISSRKGGVLLSDEFDSSLNRKIISALMKIYCNSHIKNTGQFIFTAITPEIFESLRRDQIFILTKENGVVSLTRFDQFINPENNKLARNDFSFIKAYKNNIIKNYPLEGSIADLISYMESN